MEHKCPWAWHRTRNCSSVKHVNDCVGVYRRTRNTKVIQKISEYLVHHQYNTTSLHFYKYTLYFVSEAKENVLKLRFLSYVIPTRLPTLTTFVFLWFFKNCFWCKHEESTSTNARKTPHYPLNRAQHSQNWDSSTRSLIYDIYSAPLVKCFHNCLSFEMKFSHHFLPCQKTEKSQPSLVLYIHYTFFQDLMRL